MSGGRKIEILLVEDYPVLCLGLRMIINAQDDMRVVAEAESDATAVQLATECEPDLAILCMRLQGELKGVEVCRELKNISRPPKVLFYTVHNSAAETAASFLSGADSFVFKAVDTVKFLDAVRATTSGDRIWLLGRGISRQTTTTLQDMLDSAALTRREQEVLGFMLQRFTNAEIARELVIALPTVKSHVSSILAKLGMKSRRDFFWDY